MSVESALALIESVKDYRVLFVGDRIVDEYHYVRPLGKAAKEHLIPLLYLEKEVFDGGVKAAAEHTKSFCKMVDVWAGAKEIRKVRMVEKVYLRKLAEVHYEADVIGVKPFDTNGCDVIAIADFGHGAISAQEAVNWSKHPEFLAVSAQTNSANHGYNLITKYPRADYVVIDEPEARLAAADREGHIEDVIHKLAHGRCERFIVTHGPNGAYGYDHGRFVHQKALSDHVVDTLGAGDAFFAVTAPMAKIGSMEDLLLIGCAAGAMKTKIVGHRESITKEALIEFIKSH